MVIRRGVIAHNEVNRGIGVIATREVVVKIFGCFLSPEKEGGVHHGIDHSTASAAARPSLVRADYEFSFPAVACAVVIFKGTNSGIASGFIAEYLIGHETMDADQFKAVMDENATEADLEAIAAEKARKSAEANEARKKQRELEEKKAKEAESTVPDGIYGAENFPPEGKNNETDNK